MATPITTSLMNIGMIMGDGYRFILLRANFERWEEEAEKGNKDSKQLIELVYQFERLMKLASAGKA